MATLIEIATRIQDLYEQNYTPNDRFLDIDDFKFQVATTYSSMLNAQYQIERAKNKQQDGFSNIEIPAGWLIEEEIELQIDSVRSDDFYATLKHPVFSFDWDNAANGLQGVHSVGAHHCLYRKIGLNERRFRQIMPPMSAILFFLNSSTKLIFWGGKVGSKALIQYVPKVVGEDNDCLLSDNIVAPLTDAVLDRMFKSKNGNFIKKLDNQNPNITPQQQVDPAVTGPK